MKYMCGITLPVNAAVAIREIQENYKSSSWSIAIEPHITLVEPGAALASLEQAEELLRNAVSTVSPFDITIRGIGMFDNESHTVFANVESSEELARLQYNTYCASIGFVSKPNIRGTNAGNRFHPHITLSNKLNRVLAEQIRVQLQEQHIDFTFSCNSIVLFSKEAGGALWSESKRLSF
jgi:2'-5' RNA ligase